MGDKAEVDAFAKTFCNGRQKNLDLFIGSVKANLGHIENVSGLAGLIKVVLMLEKGVIPPNSNFKIQREDLD